MLNRNNSDVHESFQADTEALTHETEGNRTFPQ